MKIGTWPMALKKQTALLLHLLFLCLLFVGTTLMIFNENYGRGLGWIREESYADTFPFTEQLESDVETIFRYVQYKDLLEVDGEINYDAGMFCVTHNSGNTKIYTLGESIMYARRLGYFLTDDYKVAGGPEVHERDLDISSMPFIEWKAYNPNEVYKEPGDAFATLEDLSVQVLTVLGEYYRIRDNFIDQPSNLYFRVSYFDDQAQEHIYTNAPELSNDNLRELGRYLFISGDSIFVDSNLRHVPENITSELATHNPYGNDDYYILLGVDVAYPNHDPYSIANARYSKIRAEFIGGALLLGISLLGLFVTLVEIARLTGRVSESSSEISLYYFDKMPFECLVLVFLLLVWLGDVLAQNGLLRIARLIVSSEDIAYATKVLRIVVLYLICLGTFLCFLRNYKAHTIWKNSLLCRGLNRILPALRGYPAPLRFSFAFAAYLACSIALFQTCQYLYRQRMNLRFSYLYLIPAIILVVFQIWIFLLQYRNRVENSKIAQGIFKMAHGDTVYKIDSAGFSEDASQISQALNSLGDGLNTALQEQVKSERLKADLITNVSHDIKTPLTSIINYVDLLKREHIQDEKIQKYLEVLDQKSQRLKTLTEDLVEASKASSGNLKLEISDIDLVELIHQSNGEFEERFAERHLKLISSLPSESILIAADGRRLWRVIENLYNNAFKYAMENSRVYVNVEKRNGYVYFTIKNVSANPLNINADELTERFVRGDVARTTEGSGLGLSIAKSLTQLQNGTFDLYIDGDLFKAQVGFAIKEE